MFNPTILCKHSLQPHNKASATRSLYRAKTAQVHIANCFQWKTLLFNLTIPSVKKNDGLQKSKFGKKRVFSRARAFQKAPQALHSGIFPTNQMADYEMLGAIVVAGAKAMTHKNLPQRTWEVSKTPSLHTGSSPSLRACSTHRILHTSLGLAFWHVNRDSAVARTTDGASHNLTTERRRQRVCEECQGCCDWSIHVTHMVRRLHGYGWDVASKY